MTDKKAEDKMPPPLKEAPKFNFLRKTFNEGQGHMMAHASAVGITFVVAIVLGLLMGWWLDKKFDTAPGFLLFGLAIGIAAGFKNLFTMSARMEKVEKEQIKKIPPLPKSKKKDSDDDEKDIWL